MTQENSQHFEELKNFHDNHYVPTRVLGDLQSYDNFSGKRKCQEFLQGISKKPLTSKVDITFGDYMHLLSSLPI